MLVFEFARTNTNDVHEPAIQRARASDRFYNYQLSKPGSLKHMGSSGIGRNLRDEKEWIYFSPFILEALGHVYMRDLLIHSSK